MGFTANLKGISRQKRKGKHRVKVGNHPHTNMMSKSATIAERSTMQDIGHALEIKGQAS